MAIATAVVALFVVLFLARHAIVRGVLTATLSSATGYRVRWDDQRLGASHAVLFGVHVTKNGDPVLDVERVDVDYALRDVFPGGQHKFGFASIAMQKPVLSIVRHADGSFSFTRDGTSATPPETTKRAAAPYFFTARVRDGVMRLIDRSPVVADLANQTVENVAIDATVNSDARTTARISGVLIGRRVQNGRFGRYPLEVRVHIDKPRGFAQATMRARELPLRGVFSFTVHSKDVRFDDGVLYGTDARLYSLLAHDADGFTYRLGGTTTLRDGRLALSALAQPIRTLGGNVAITDAALASPAIAGAIGGVPVRGRGALYDLFGTPRFRLGLSGDGDVHALRGVFAFSADQPLHGGVHVETLLTARVDNPLIRTWVDGPDLAYGAYPLRDAHAIVDYYNSSVLVYGTHARYGGVDVLADGIVDFLINGNDVRILARASGPGAQLPYAEALAPDAFVTADALIAQRAGDPPGFTARGVALATGPTHGALAFAVDRRGVGEFGPFAFDRDDGTALAGGFALERPISQSAGWVHARRFRLAQVRAMTQLPGAQLPALPPIAGTVDGDLVGAGTPDAFAVAGSVSGSGIVADRYPLGQVSTTLAGSLDDVRLTDLHADGPLGRFDGSGAYGGGVLALDGRYDGSFDALRPVTNDASAHGGLHGPLRLAIGPDRVVVQTTGVDLARGSYRGIPVERLAGTVALDTRPGIDGGALRIVAADAQVAGARIAAVDAGGPFAVAAPDVAYDALHLSGIPLAGGTLGLFGLADLRNATRFDGAFVLQGARLQGRPVTGNAAVVLDRSRVAVRDGAGGTGRTFGAFDGTIDGVGGALGYDLRARVPVGEIDDVRALAQLPVRNLEGSFGADVRVHGTPRVPHVDGAVSVPVGFYNGLAFEDARATVAAAPGAVSARNGVVRVGSTRAAVGAQLVGRAYRVDVRAPHADLADFDDYFDEGDVLSGRGPLAISFANDGRSTRTDGALAIAGLRVRALSFGDAHAAWTQPRANAPIAVRAGASGATGTVEARATVVPASGDAVRAFTAARYDGTVRASAVALTTWLPAFGLIEPVTGLLDGTLAISGRYPRLGVAGDVAVRDGTAFGYAVREAHVRAASDGARVMLSDGVLAFDFARFDIAGSLGLAPHDPLALDVRLQSGDLARSLKSLLPNRYLPVGGTLTANARVGGTFAAPRAVLGFEAANASYGGFDVPRVLGQVAYDGATLTVRDIEASFARGGTATVSGRLPIALQPFGVRSAAPLSFTLGLSQVPLAPFAPLLPGEGTKLGGIADGRVAVEGTIAAPRLVGSLGLRDGSYVSSFDRAGVSGANADLAFDGTALALRTLHANVGGGTLDGSGDLDLPFPNAPRRGYTVTLIAKGARLDNPTFGRGQIDGTMTLASARALPSLSGDVTLSNASIPFGAVYRSGGPAGTSSGGPGPFNVAFDVHAKAGRNVRVQSNIIDIGAVGGLTLTGTLQSPKLDGVLTATPGGYFTTYNRAFRVQQATLTFDPQNGITPYVDLRAFTHVSNPDPDPSRNPIGSADITIVANGPADQLASGSGLEFSSNPGYSREQIIGLLADLSVLGAVNFNSTPNGTSLRGAPGESNALLPPGVTPYQAGVLSFNQEAFSLLNAQVTQRFLAPIERLFTERLGVSDFEITVDYGGGIGYNVLKQIGHRDVYATFGQTLTSPLRTALGFTARPNSTTSVLFDYYSQDYAPALTNNANGTQPFAGQQRLKGIRPLGNQQGFTFQIIRKYP